MNIDFADYLQENHIIYLKKNATKKEIIEKLVTFGAELKGFDREKIWRAVWQREEQLSTGIGHGVALPHGRIKGFGNPLVVIGVCENESVDYIGLDDLPVRIVFLVVTDDNDRERYLGILKSLSNRLVRQPELFASVIEKCKTPAELASALKKK